MWAEREMFGFEFVGDLCLGFEMGRRIMFLQRMVGNEVEAALKEGARREQ